MIVFSATGRVFEYNLSADRIPIIFYKDIDEKAFQQLTEGYMTSTKAKPTTAKKVKIKAKNPAVKKPKYNAMRGEKV